MSYQHIIHRHAVDLTASCCKWRDRSPSVSSSESAASSTTKISHW